MTVVCFQIFYVAHSQAAAGLTVMLANKPAMKDVIEKAILYGSTETNCFTDSGLGVQLSVYINYFLGVSIDT